MIFAELDTVWTLLGYALIGLIGAIIAWLQVQTKAAVQKAEQTALETAATKAAVDEKVAEVARLQRLEAQQAAVRAAVKAEEVKVELEKVNSIQNAKMAVVVAKVENVGVKVDTVATKMDNIGDRVEVVHKATNSLTDKLVAVTEKEALARGGAEERERVAEAAKVVTDTKETKT